MKFKLTSVVLITMLGIYGCGGGGSTSNPTAPVNPATTPPATTPSDSVLPPTIALPGTTPPDSTPGTAPPAAGNSESELRKLLGELNLNFTTSNNGQPLSLTITWSETAFNDDRTVLLALNSEGTSVTGCGVAGDRSNEFVCILLEFASASSDEITGALFWAFELTSATTGSGVMEVCSIPLNIESCTNDLINNPDGSVAVTINPNVIATSSAADWTINDQEITFYEALTFIEADKAQFGELRSSSASTTEITRSIPKVIDLLLR